MLKYCNVCLGLLLGHYYSNGTQVVINVTAHSDIFLSHLTNTDMKYVFSYARVLLPQISLQLQWGPKHSKLSIMLYYRLKSMLFTHVLLMLFILFLLEQYKIVSEDQSH